MQQFNNTTHTKYTVYFIVLFAVAAIVLVTLQLTHHINLNN